MKVVIYIWSYLFIQIRSFNSNVKILNINYVAFTAWDYMYIFETIVSISVILEIR